MQSSEHKPALRFRKLRIAWSVFCGLACVLLIVLWVRSYERFTKYGLSGDSFTRRFQGQVVTAYSFGVSLHLSVTENGETYFPQERTLGFGALAKNGSKTIALPYWSMTVA